MRSQLPPGTLGPEQAAAVEAEAFWCFAALMERAEGNFAADGT